MAQNQSYVITIVGCSHYSEGCSAMLNDDDWMDALTFEWDVHNVHDDTAVIVKYTKHVIGFVSRATKDLVWKAVKAKRMINILGLVECAFVDKSHTQLKWFSVEVSE